MSLLLGRLLSLAVSLNPGPEWPPGLLAFAVTQHLSSIAIYQLKQLITRLTQVTWFLGSISVVDPKVRIKNSRLCGTPGPGLSYGHGLD